MAKRSIEEQVTENSLMLKVLEKDLETIATNHLTHLAEDIKRVDAKVNKMDNRLWWILSILVASTVVGMLGDSISGIL